MGRGCGVAVGICLEVFGKLGIVPGNLFYLVKEFEFADPLFAQFRGQSGLVRGIAKIDAAAEGATIAGGAKMVDLKRTSRS